jgi:hypothetical protein
MQRPWIQFAGRHGSIRMRPRFPLWVILRHECGAQGCLLFGQLQTFDYPLERAL